MSAPSATLRSKTSDETSAVSTTAGKKVTPAELFCDLVFVFAIVQVSALLHHDHTWAGIGHAAVLFLPLFWAWSAISIHANLNPIENSADRITMFVAALGALFMAVSVPDAFGDRGIIFGAAYLVQRAALTLHEAITPTDRHPGLFFLVFFQISGPLMFLGGFLAGNARLAVWILAIAIDVVMPRLMRRQLGRMTFDLPHLLERHGLFLLIALGESILSVGATAVTLDRLTSPVIATMISGFALACGLWWIYFVFAGAALEERLPVAIARLRTDQLGRMLGFSHLWLVAGVIAVAVGLAEAIAHPEHHLDRGIASLLFGGVALYLATFGYTTWRMFRRLPLARLVSAALVLGMLPFATEVPAVLALLDLAVVLMLLAIIEYAVRAYRDRKARQRHPDPEEATT
ncbi:low temperature requirement protein A [Hamadaea sp. NPDC051192]|uniref:low temperature requirement protein A n=1 Tax=Hamadaea sp. NPDC051192 TaxID=3154940 RepID=UPI003449A2C2